MSRLERDILTPQETLAYGREFVDRLIKDTFFEFKAGDQFFIKDQPDRSYVVVDDLFDKDTGMITLVYGDNQKISDGDVYPLFTTGMLIELLSFAFHFNLQTFGGTWTLLWNDAAILQSIEEESLLQFLWRSLSLIVEANRYTW